MKKGKKISLWIIGIFLVLLFAFLFLFPRLVNLDTIKERVLTRISEDVGGEATFQDLDLSLFPRPHALIHQADLSIPGKAKGSIASLKIYPAVWPLFTGKLQLAAIQALGPEFEITLPKRRDPKSEGPDPPLSTRIQETLTALLPLLALNAPDLVAEIENAALDFSEEGQPPLFSSSDTDARMDFPPNGLKIRLSCTSSLWGKMELNGTLDLENLEGMGRIEMTNFHPHRLTHYFFPDALVRLVESQAHLNLEFSFIGAEELRAHLDGSFPRLVLQRGTEDVVLSGKKVRGVFEMDGEKITASLSKLELDSPHLHVNGDFLLDQEDASQVSLELEARDLDVHSIRETALALAGDVPIINKMLEIVLDGTIPLLTVSARENQLADLGSMENLLIQGHMKQGALFIPKAELDLTDVEGDVVISKGILEGRNLKATMGNTAGREGTLTLGLKGKDAPFHLDIMLGADLAQLPLILNRVVKTEAFAKEISLIQEMEGNATGRLILGDTLESIKAQVDVSEFNTTVTSQRIPFPLEIIKGGFFLSETKIDMTNLAGTLGKSSFSNLSAGIDLTKDPYLNVESGEARIQLDEVRPWVISFEPLPLAEISKNLGIEGLLTLSTLTLKGRLENPSDWLLTGTGQVQKLVLNSSRFPGPVKVSEGSFRIIEDTTKQQLHFSETQISMLDASLTMSGSLSGYRRGLDGAKFSFDGVMRSESVARVSELLHVPPEFKLRSPLSISNARLVWEKEIKTAFEGDLTVQNGPRIALDILQNPDGFMLRNLQIQDQDSRASSKFNLGKTVFDFEFAGNLARTTIQKIFSERQAYAGMLEGDFKAHILLDQPERSTAQGTLRGSDLLFPWGLKVPLKIDGISLDAQENTIRVESAICSMGRCRGGIEGTVRMTETGLVLDMELISEGLDWNNITLLFDKASEGTGERRSDTLWDMPVRGVIRLNAGYFVYDRFTLRPLHADIAFSPNLVEIAVIEADYCGISTHGILQWTSKGFSLDLHLKAENQELDPTVQCLRGEEIRATGLFDLKGTVKAGGSPDQWINSLEGEIEINARDGQIQHHVPLEKVFAYLSVMEVFRGELPRMKEEGLAYKTITMRGAFQEGKLVLNEAILDGYSMDVAAEGSYDLAEKKIKGTLLVAPMKTADSVIKKIPGVNYIMGGTLVSIPVKVEGHVSDPEVKVLPPSAVSAGLMGMMKRTLELPFEVIKAVVPENGKEATEESQE